MKKLLVLFLFLYSGTYAQQPTKLDSSYSNGHYRQRLEFFRMMPDRKNEIVFLGNSITEAGEWQELVPFKNVVNRGISGDVTFGIVARLDEVLSSKPQKIFLLIGINDLKRGLPKALICKNYEKIINRVRKDSPKTTLIIQSILPVNESMMSPEYKRITNAEIRELNGLVAQMAHRPKVIYVDLHPVFENSDGQMDQMYTTDGIHLKMAAYIRWIACLDNKKLL